MALDDTSENIIRMGLMVVPGLSELLVSALGLKEPPESLVGASRDVLQMVVEEIAKRKTDTFSGADGFIVDPDLIAGKPSD